MCPRRRRLSNPNRSPQAFCTGIRAGAFPRGISGRPRQAWVLSPSSRGWGLEGRAASRTDATRGPDLQGTTACPAAVRTRGGAAAPGQAFGRGWGGALAGTETEIRRPVSGNAAPERRAAQFVSKGAEWIGRKLPGLGRETAEERGPRVSRCRERRGERAATPIGEFPGTGRIIFLLFPSICVDRASRRTRDWEPFFLRFRPYGPARNRTATLSSAQGRGLEAAA